MDLTVNDISHFLKISEETVLNWAELGKIPSYKLNQEYRFSREEIDEWMMRYLNEEGSPLDINEHPVGLQHFNLYRALHKGIVLEDVPGDNKQEVISNSMKVISRNLNLDAEVITNLLLDREKLMSTSLSRGIAVPHTRDFLLSSVFDVVATVYPKKPIEFGALDGQKAHTLFFLFACQDKKHLNLLAKIAFFCHQEENLKILQNRPSKKELLNAVRIWESQLAHSHLQPA